MTLQESYKYNNWLKDFPWTIDSWTEKSFLENLKDTAPGWALLFYDTFKEIDEIVSANECTIEMCDYYILLGTARFRLRVSTEIYEEVSLLMDEMMDLTSSICVICGEYVTHEAPSLSSHNYCLFHYQEQKEKEKKEKEKQKEKRRKRRV
jgi:hypothetical protein